MGMGTRMVRQWVSSCCHLHGRDCEPKFKHDGSKFLQESTRAMGTRVVRQQVSSCCHLVANICTEEVLSPSSKYNGSKSLTRVRRNDGNKGGKTRLAGVLLLSSVRQTSMKNVDAPKICCAQNS